MRTWDGFFTELATFWVCPLQCNAARIASAVSGTNHTLLIWSGSSQWLLLISSTFMRGQDLSLTMWDHHGTAAHRTHLDDLVQALKVVVAEREYHPAWVLVLPPALEGRLCYLCHLQQA